jgi:hypothetical protein
MADKVKVLVVGLGNMAPRMPAPTIGSCWPPSSRSTRSASSNWPDLQQCYSDMRHGPACPPDAGRTNRRIPMRESAAAPDFDLAYDLVLRGGRFLNERNGVDGI